MKKYAYCSVLLMLFMSMSAAMTGCADTDENADATADDPLRKPELLHKRGPYHVGVYETKVTYQPPGQEEARTLPDRKSTRLNSSHVAISYAVFCLKKKTTI